MTYQEYVQNVLVDGPWIEFNLPLSGRVLDVGSGSGWTVSALREKGLDALGLDMVPTESGTVAGDARLLPFRAGTFEGIVCFRVLHHISDSRSVLKEFARILRPHGFLLLALGNVRAYTLLASREGHWRIPNLKESHYELYDRDRLITFLESTGFDVIAMRTCHFLPRILSKVGPSGFHRLLASADPALGSNRVTGGFGPLLLTCARRT